MNATHTFEIAYKILPSDQYFVSITPDRGFLKPKEEIEIVAKIPTRLLATRAAVDFKQNLIVFYAEAIEKSNPPGFVDDLRLEIIFFDYCRTKKLTIDFKSEEYINNLEKRNIKAYIHFPIN
uniref:Uncharacterized protein n=1 Tax=Romanomermis culicivorax TaxID=13658 RepID=A0A915K3L6_ROMCU